MASRRMARRANSDPTFYNPRPLKLLLKTGLLPVFQPSAPIAFSLDDELSDSPTEAESESSSSTSSSHSTEPLDVLSDAQSSLAGLYSDPHPTGPVDIPLPSAQLLQSLASRPTFPSPVIHSGIGNFGAANGYNTSGSGWVNNPVHHSNMTNPPPPYNQVPPRTNQPSTEGTVSLHSSTSASGSFDNPLCGTSMAESSAHNQSSPQTNQASMNSTVSGCTSASPSVPREKPVVNVEFQELDGELDYTSDNLEARSDYFVSDHDRTESSTNLVSPPSSSKSISSTSTDDTISLGGSDDTIVFKSDRYYKQYVVDARQVIERELGIVLEPNWVLEHQKKCGCFEAPSSHDTPARNQRYKPSPLSQVAYVDEEIIKAVTSQTVTTSKTDLPEKDEMEGEASSQEENL